MAVPNEVHQADLHFLPHDRVGRKTFRYALTVVEVASRYKEAEPLTTKKDKEVADALCRIYRRGPLKWPNLLQVDPGRGFMGVVSQLLAKHGVEVRRGRVDTHQHQGIVERFNRTLAERLFGHQYAQKMRLPSGQRSTEWVKRLPAVVAALDRDVTRSTGKKLSLFRLHSGQISLTLSWMWPAELTNRSTLNYWVSLAGKPIGARCCTRHSDCSGPPSVLGCDQPSG